MYHNCGFIFNFCFLSIYNFMWIYEIKIHLKPYKLYDLLSDTVKNVVKKVIALNQ